MPQGVTKHTMSPHSPSIGPLTEYYKVGTPAHQITIQGDLTESRQSLEMTPLIQSRIGPQFPQAQPFKLTRQTSRRALGASKSKERQIRTTTWELCLPSPR